MSVIEQQNGYIAFWNETLQLQTLDPVPLTPTNIHRTILMIKYTVRLA